MYFVLKHKIQSCDEKGSENIGTLLGTLPLVYFARCLKELSFTTVTVILKEEDPSSWLQLIGVVGTEITKKSII